MKPSHRLGAAVLFAVLGNTAASATPSAPCDLRLTVDNNHADYRLDLLRQEGSSLIELDLAGPGPEYLCESVIETKRRDAYVLSVHVDSPEAPTATVVITPVPAQEWPGVHLSRAGIGSLYWAARHPSEAWRVVLPIEPGHAPGEAGRLHVARATVRAGGRINVW